MNNSFYVKNNDITYIVKPGDIIYQIASNYHITVAQLMYFNHLTSTILTVGQILKIPTFSRENSQQFQIHIVKKEDSLYTISKKYNTTVSTIKKHNNLTNNLLSIGQQLIIPK